MAEHLAWLDVTKEETTAPFKDETTVLVHDDGVTPTDYTAWLLQSTFELSDELAEHVAWVAQTAGLARVVNCSQSEAERLVRRAHIAVRRDGFTLTFSLEAETSQPQKDTRKNVIHLAYLTLSTALFLLLAVGVAVADRAGAVAF